MSKLILNMNIKNNLNRIKSKQKGSILNQNDEIIKNQNKGWEYQQNWNLILNLITCNRLKATEKIKIQNLKKERKKKFGKYWELINLRKLWREIIMPYSRGLDPLELMRLNALNLAKDFYCFLTRACTPASSFTGRLPVSSFKSKPH